MICFSCNGNSSHIRQLLFIVLYSSPTPDGRERGSDNPVSGSKQQQKSIYIPTSEARDSAIRLLMSFSITNTPNSLLRALPGYPDPADDSNSIPDLGDDDEDSPVGKEASRLKDGKGCWSVLKSGFIKRQDLAMLVASPKKKGNKRRQDSFEDDIFNTSESTEPPSVVSENAWPVLDWLIGLFEKDEAITENAGLGASSSFFFLSHSKICQHDTLRFSCARFRHREIDPAGK
jgi:hypothetical protein